jgi:alkylated DNA repair protein (DNA oxidative demethylase)
MSGIEGTSHLPGYLDRDRQTVLVAELRQLVRKAAFFTPVMPRSGRPFSVQMTNLGELGWVSDRKGYRYQAEHPVSGRPWPGIPEMILDIWRDVAGYPDLPQACLVNYYRDGARMGPHRDEDEEALEAPVVSVSLGDSAVFRVGGLERRDATRSFKVHSGDVVVMGGQSRLRYHGIDRIIGGSSTLLKDGGRINLTLRRVTR